MKSCGDWPVDAPRAIVTGTQLDDTIATMAALTATKSPD
jgi:hypothetical protein